MYLPTTALQRAAHFDIFSFSAFFLNVNLDSFSARLASCTEDALNPVQVVVAGTHTEAGSSRSIRSPSLPRTTAHRGTSTLQDWGKRRGREVSAQLSLAEASVDHM